jgi:hypothetical protein
MNELPPFFAQLGVKTDVKVFKKIHLSCIIEYVGREHKVRYLSFSQVPWGRFYWFCLPMELD